MIKIVCPDCKQEEGNHEIVNVSAHQRRYEFRCPDCGKTFVPPPLTRGEPRIVRLESVLAFLNQYKSPHVLPDRFT
jgi:transposase-like protein